MATRDDGDGDDDNDDDDEFVFGTRSIAASIVSQNNGGQQS